MRNLNFQCVLLVVQPISLFLTKDLSYMFDYKIIYLLSCSSLSFFYMWKLFCCLTSRTLRVYGSGNYMYLIQHCPTLLFQNVQCFSCLVKNVNRESLTHTQGSGLPLQQNDIMLNSTVTFFSVIKFLPTFNLHYRCKCMHGPSSIKTPTEINRRGCTFLLQSEIQEEVDLGTTSAY